MNDLYITHLADTEDKQLHWNVGLYLHYQHNPLVLRETGSGSDRIARAIVAHQAMGDLMAAISPMRWWDVGVAVPFLLYQQGEGIANRKYPLQRLRPHAASGPSSAASAGGDLPA